MHIRLFCLTALMLLLISAPAFAAEIVVKEPMTEVPGDLALIQSPLRDMSGNWCTLLKINTDLAPFNGIQSNMTPMKTVNKTGEVWVYLSPGERRLYFTKTGYAKLIYDIPLNMQSNVVYSMKLIGSGINLSKAIGVTIKVTPADAVVTIADTMRCDISKPVLLEPGKYNLSISQSGFKTITERIEVTADKIFFEYTLQPIEQVPVTLKSNPSEADIYIDNLSEGKTNKTIFKYPGSYALRLIKAGYETIEQKLTVTESGTNIFTYNLEKSSSTLTVTLNPADATLYVDNQEVSSLSLELAPGTHKLEARKAGYDSQSKQITLVKGKPAAETLTLSQQKGKLVFTIQPMEARVSLSSGQTWEGSDILSLPVGEYTATATYAGYTQKQTRFTIEKDKDSKVDLVLMKSVTPAAAPAVTPVVTNNATSKPVTSSNDMVYVEGGTFTMGDTADGIYTDEKPTHQVTLSSFYIGKYEVTQQQWQEVMGSNPSKWKGDTLPVESVSWNDCVEFCNKLSRKEGLTPCYSGSGASITCDWTANGYRLPTEAEWEFAARGGKQSKNYTYSGGNDIGSVAWHDGNSGSQTHPVGGKQANELGIYDMSGNVWEWNWDWYGTYASGAQTNPHGVVSGSYRVLRGGSWFLDATSCPVSFRLYNVATYSDADVGFRVVRISP